MGEYGDYRELSELSGEVRTVIFQNEENGYTVLRLKTETGEVTVVGCIPMCAPGEQLLLTGSWTTHRQHGQQFSAEMVQTMLPTGISGIYEYLASGAIRGIGPATAKLLVDRFGADTLRVIEREPERLVDIRGISAKRAGEISEEFIRLVGVRRLMELLVQYSLPPQLAMRLYVDYGEQAVPALYENPYIVTGERYGVDFAAADAMALELGFDGDCPERVGAAIIFEMVHNLNNGHCFLPREKLAAAASALISVETDTAEAALGQLLEAGEIVNEEVAGVDACYLPRLYESEQLTAARLADMVRRKPLSRQNVSKIVAGIERRLGIEYAAKQREAIELAARSNVLVLTGGPGTGKTTVVRAIAELFDELGLDIALCAPTGRAAKRLGELTGRDALTVHRLLEAGFGAGGSETVFARSASDPLDCDAVILDECSMVDINLMAALLDAMREDCRLVLVGDSDQLPSVGAGNVFSDIIRSDRVPTVRLTEIFRQAQDSRIVVNAHRINSGQLPELGKNEGDFFFMKRAVSERTAETIVELCAKRLPEGMGFAPERIQVLSPTRRGETGTVSLNRRLQAALNPPAEEKDEKIFGEITFRTGDRVMQIRNDYDIIWKDSRGQAGSGVYNGDIGRITEINNAAETMTVFFDEEREAVYDFGMLSELELAYAVTVHKSQGSEYPAVVLCSYGVPKNLVSRSVLYTAVTRARQLLVIVGDPEVVSMMTANDRRRRRYSGLRWRLARYAEV